MEPFFLIFVYTFEHSEILTRWFNFYASVPPERDPLSRDSDGKCSECIIA